MISPIYAMLSRILALFQRNRRELDLDDELQFHLEMETRERMRAGMPAAEASAAARRNFGGIDQVKEAYREQRSLPAIEVILQDLRYSLRMILRTPLLYALLLLIFALGIGVNTAVFSIVDAVLLRPLPFPRSEDLVRIWYTDAKTGQRFLEASYPDVAALREKLRAVAQIAAFSYAPRILNDTKGEPVHVAVGRLSDDISSVLGEPNVAGRGFTEAEIHSGDRVVMLSYRFWLSRYAGSPAVLGEPLRIDNETYRVVGVAGRHAFPVDIDLWRPLSRAEWEDDDREFQIIARMKPGMTLLGFFAALAITLASLGIYGIIADWVGEREHEIGVRRALGAEESAVMWMVLKSGLRLTICGVLFGVLAALWLERLAVSILFQVSPSDPLTFASVVLAVTAVAVAAAAIPAFRASRIDPARSLRSV